MDDLLSFESSSLASDSFKTSDGSLTTTDADIKNEPAFLSDAELHALAKDRQKKDNHNMSQSVPILFCIGFLLSKNVFQSSAAADLISMTG